MEGNIEDLKRQIQGWINQQQSKGKPFDINDINKQMAKMTKSHNTSPRPEFNGFTREEMSKMLYSPLEQGCPVRLKRLTDEQISQIPIMRQALLLMNSLNDKELKLTAKGNLPVKMVEQLYEIGSQSQYSDYYEHKTEERCEEVRVLRVVLEETGLIKKLMGKLTLTPKGTKLLKDPNELLYTIMYFLLKKFHTGWLDWYEDEHVGNVGRAYSVWLLHHFGAEWRRIEFYAQQYHKAFPDLEEIDAYSVRVFDLLFHIIGICEINDNTIGYGNEETRKTPLLDMMFSFKEPTKK